MARPTIASLTADREHLIERLAHAENQLAASQGVLDAVKRERDEAVEALHRLKDELLASKLPAPIRVLAPRAPRSLPEHMQRARELAMRTGRSVRVG